MSYPLRIVLLIAALSLTVAAPARAQSGKAIGLEKVREAVEQLPDDFRSPNRYALLIGASEYADERIPDLPACANDVELVHEVLADPNVGMFPRENITRLVGKQVTRTRVIEALDQLSRKARADDLVLVLFSGHGAVDARQRAYWIMHSTRADSLRATALPELDVSDLLAEMRTQRLITIIDACYSAATADLGRTKSLLPKDKLQQQFDGKGRVAITGSSGEELSVVITDRDHPGYNHSAFAWHVAAGLRGEADRVTPRPDGAVTLSELWNYVKDRTARTAHSQGGSQSPQLKGQVGSRFLVTIDAPTLLSAHSAGARQIATLKRWADAGKLDARRFALGKRLISQEPADLGEDEQKLRRTFVDLAEGRLALDYLEVILAGMDRMANAEAPLPGDLDPATLKPETVAALRELQQAAEVGDHDATYFIGRAFNLAADHAATEPSAPPHYNDRQVEHWKRYAIIREDPAFTGSFEESYHWWKRAAEADHGYAVNAIGVMYKNGEFVEKDAEEAVRWYRRGIELGNVYAIGNLGYMYKHGDGVAQDDREAVRWYRKAAEAGSTSGMNNLGTMYEAGRGVEKDYDQARRLYRQAADLGDAQAMENLGDLYKDGHGVEQNDAEALRWYRKAADLGHGGAMASLGWMYEEGRGVDRDYQEAVRWYRQAAERGNAWGMTRLGWMYEEGRGVDRDYQEAVRWYREAAERGSAWAMNNLGVMYANGEGVDQDEREAIRWYRKAARLGNETAQENLDKRGLDW